MMMMLMTDKLLEIFHHLFDYMTYDQAHRRLFDLYRESKVFRGMVYGCDGDGGLAGLPDKFKDPTEHKNLIQMLRFLADGFDSQPEEKK